MPQHVSFNFVYREGLVVTDLAFMRTDFQMISFHVVGKEAFKLKEFWANITIM